MLNNSRLVIQEWIHVQKKERKRNIESLEFSVGVINNSDTSEQSIGQGFKVHKFEIWQSAIKERHCLTLWRIDNYFFFNFDV